MTMYNLDPITREEEFLAKMAGRDVETPEPITRLEQFYDDAAKGGGGSSVTVEPLTVTQNGTQIAPSGKAYSPVTVAVPIQASKSVTIDEAGTVIITPDSGYEAMEEVVVTAEVPSVSTMALIDTYDNSSTSVNNAVWLAASKAVSGAGALVAVDDQNVKHLITARSRSGSDYTLNFGDSITFAYTFSPASVTITGATSLTMYRTTFSYPS